MAKKKVDFHKLGDELWNIANIFRDDTLKTTEYLEEFSYFLFLKLFDDQERQKEEIYKIDGKTYNPYLPGELRFYTWADKIISGEISINEVVPTVKNIFQRLATIQDHNGRDLSLFRKLFGNHIWRIKYSSTIRDLLKRLVDLELEQNFDVMGRAYEFVVQKLGEQKQYGQYFTPRHIIHFMVELADPEIGEKIYDPAAGTGGFILRAFEVVRKKIDALTKETFQGVREPVASYGGASFDKAEKLHRELKENCLWAVEKAPDVYKLALMNMILHNDGKSHLYEADSLDNRAQLEHKQKYNVVLSNPPYGPLTQSRVGTFDYHVKRFEALFIQHIMNALKFSESGKKPSRAVVIILDKILFDSTRAFKSIRQKLLREYNLKGVFSMPAGIFQPYSGVKTTVLYFEKPTKDQWNEIKANNDYTTKQVLFFDVKSDGFTLSTQRRPINRAFQGDEPNIYEPPCGDLPKAVKVFKEWLKALDNGKIEEFKEKYVDNEQIWLADIEEIKEKDFNLNPGLYRKVERGKVKWEWVRLGEICEVEKGTSITKAKVKPGDIPVIAGGQQPAYYHSEANRDGNVITVSASGAYAGFVQYFSTPIFASDCSTIKSCDESAALTKFIFYVLKGKQNDIYQLQRGAGQPHVYPKDLKNIKIPLPPLEIQQKIVERLDKQQAIIEKSKEMEKAILDAGIDDAIFEGDWEWVELGEVILLKYGKGLPERGRNTNGNYNVYGSNGVVGNHDEYFIEDQTIIIGRKGSVGEITLTTPKCWAIDTTYYVEIKEKDNLLLKYLYYVLKSKNLKELAIISGVPGINRDMLYNLKIPLPPLEKQKEIVKFLDTQFQALEKIRKMRENAEKMIKIILEKEVFGNE